jgi:hypothetical protein
MGTALSGEKNSDLLHRFLTFRKFIGQYIIGQMKPNLGINMPINIHILMGEGALKP